MQMSDQIGSAARVPRSVGIFSPILRFLLAHGVPLGYNRLVTIRGRKSGLPRTAAIAVLEIGGRRWVWAPWGDVHWVRNLRAAGRATSPVEHRKQGPKALHWLGNDGGRYWIRTSDPADVNRVL